jgi:two-component system CheB/CheR fusion protein
MQQSPPEPPVIENNVSTVGHQTGIESIPGKSPLPPSSSLSGQDSISNSILSHSAHPPIGAAEDQVTGAGIRSYELTEPKLADLASARLAAIVEGSDDAIIAKDLHGIIQSWNLGAERIFGYTAEQVIGKSITLLIPPDRLGEEAMILDSIRRGDHVDHYESVRRHKDGRLLNVSLTISPIANSQGQIVGASKIARDITGRKLADAALVKSEKLVAAGRLAATMAHEINNPLQAITNLMSILADSPKLGPDERALAKMAEDELGRITHLTRQSLSFYRESNSSGPVNLEDTVEGVLNIFANQMKTSQIACKTRYPSDVPEIDSFAGEIRQVITAILLNAIDAVPRKGTIAVRIRNSSRGSQPSTAGFRVSIADNGVGIPPAIMSRIFEPFFTTKGEQGTGLGLWVANGIVSRLGGSIRVRSTIRLGRTGTCFSIFFPLQMPGPARRPEPELAAA